MCAASPIRVIGKGRLVFQGISNVIFLVGPGIKEEVAPLSHESFRVTQRASKKNIKHESCSSKSSL